MGTLPISEESLQYLSQEEIRNLARFQAIYKIDSENQEVETYRHFTIYAKAVQAGFYNEGL